MFRGVHSAIHAAVGALTWWVLAHWEQLQGYIASYKTLALPAMLAALALLFRMSNPLAAIVIEKIPLFSRLLRKVLTGKDFIEGDWPLVVVDMQRGEPLYFGFLSIDFRDGQLYVHGDDWHTPAPNLMFVRLRTSATNLRLVDRAVAAWTAAKVPVVITFMAYYDHEPVVPEDLIFKGKCYEWRVRHINSYWCPTKDFMRWVMSRYRDNRLVSMCSSIESSYCRNCRNCETYYLQTMKRLRNE